MCPVRSVTYVSGRSLTTGPPHDEIPRTLGQVIPPNEFRSRCSYAERKCATATKGSILWVAGYFLHEPKDALRTVAANDSPAVNDRKLPEYNALKRCAQSLPVTGER